MSSQFRYNRFERFTVRSQHFSGHITWRQGLTELHSDEPRVKVRFTSSWQHSKQSCINACFLWPLLWLIHFLRSGPSAVSAFKQVSVDYFAEPWTPATQEMSAFSHWGFGGAICLGVHFCMHVSAASARWEWQRIFKSVGLKENTRAGRASLK